MREIKNFKVKYDYCLALIDVSGAETLIGGAEKIVKKALKDTKNPNCFISLKDRNYFVQKIIIGHL